jgi:hypothetical protein
MMKQEFSVSSKTIGGIATHLILSLHIIIIIIIIIMKLKKRAVVFYSVPKKTFIHAFI